MGYKIFVDTNVYLDFLMQRGDNWESAKAIFKLAEQGLIAVFTSSSSVINIMYVMERYKIERHTIIANIQAILSFTNIVNPDNTTFEIAFSSGFNDMEDAVQYFTALEIKKVNYFITSNLKDYKSALPHLLVLTPGAFIKEYNKGR